MRFAPLLAIGVAGALLLAGRADASTGVVSFVKGEVMLGRGTFPGAEQPAAQRDAITPDQYLRTAAAAFAEVEFPAAAHIRVGPLSVFRYRPESEQYILDRGEGLFVFPKGKSRRTVATPSFAAGILGTTVYVKITPTTVEYACLEGRCQIGPHILTPGEKLSLPTGQPGYTAPKRKFDLKNFLARNPLVTAFPDPLPNRELRDAERAR